MVTICGNNDNGCCTFGPVNCWFKQNDIHENVKNHNVIDHENHEVVKQIFDLMESFASKLVKIENSL